MRLRVLSYNVHKCIGGVDRSYKPERVIETIARLEPDIALLQEVDAGAKRSRRETQAEMLAEKLGYRYYAWYPLVKVRGGGHHGNAILSRFPLHHEQNIDLTTPPKKVRGSTYAHLRVRAGKGDERKTRTLHLCSVHLGLAQIERKIQLRKLLESDPISNIHSATPTIIGGDLNDVYGNLGKKILLPAGFRTGERLLHTFPAYAPVRALDGIYVRGDLSLVSLMKPRMKLARAASDHLPLLAEIDIL